MEAVRRSCPGWRWSPLGWKSANPNELLRALVFYRRETRRSLKMWHQQTNTHSSSWRAACGCRSTSVCERFKPDSHILVISQGILTSTWYLLILVLLSRTHSHRGVQTQGDNEGSSPCEEHKQHMTLMIQTGRDSRGTAVFKQDKTTPKSHSEKKNPGAPPYHSTNTCTFC